MSTTSEIDWLRKELQKEKEKYKQIEMKLNYSETSRLIFVCGSRYQNSIWYFAKKYITNQFISHHKVFTRIRQQYINYTYSYTNPTKEYSKYYTEIANSATKAVKFYWFPEWIINTNEWRVLNDSKLEELHDAFKRENINTIAFGNSINLIFEDATRVIKRKDDCLQASNSAGGLRAIFSHSKENDPKMKKCIDILMNVIKRCPYINSASREKYLETKVGKDPMAKSIVENISSDLGIKYKY